MHTRLSLLLCAMFLLVACGDDDTGMATDVGVDASDASVDSAMDAPDTTPPDYPAADGERSTVTIAGVRRELFLVDGVEPPPNPVHGTETPSELNRTQVVRYRQDVEPAVAPRAILIGMPGFLAGGPSYEGLARDMVLRGAASGEAIEVWTIDRRSNLQEDHRGMNAADALGDPEAANDYYFRNGTVGGESFEGFLGQDELRFESEWGLGVHVEDLRRVIALIPEADRRGHVFLLGHSLGARFAEAYASWRFEDGMRGAEELAGIVLLDGLLATAPISEEDYLEGQDGLLPMPGLTGIRENQAFTELPLLGVSVVARAEVLAMRALISPDEVLVDGGRDRTLGLLMGYPAALVPSFTNKAAFAVALDDNYSALSFIRSRMGVLTGGPVETYTGIISMAEVERPSDSDATYAWMDGEATPVEVLADAFSHGATNFAEWYFPSRLAIDLNAVGGANVAEDGWQASYGLRVYDGSLMDAPVLCVPAELFGPVANCEPVRDRVAATVGDGRPHAGATRDDELGFRVIDAFELAHLDPTLATDNEDNPVPAALEQFVSEHLEEGDVMITVPE